LSKYNSSKELEVIVVKGSKEVILFSLKDILDKKGKLMEQS